MDYEKIIPWNTGEFPIKVHNIRFNQNNTLFTLATSRGYKIFSAKTLRKVQEETEYVRDFEDLKIVMTYYESNIVFCIAKKNNEKISQKELIIFDDYSQKIIGKFKSKEENIINFYVSKNALFIALENNLVIIELISFKIIEIIEKVEINNKLVSFNVNNTISYLIQNQPNKIFINKYIFQKNKFFGLEKKYIKNSFDWVQNINLSQSGNFIAIVSILGNKIHIYEMGNCSLIKCILIGNKIFNIEKIAFIFNKTKENYFSVNINNKNIKIYKINNEEKENNFCVCDKYLDDDVLNGKIKPYGDYYFFSYFMPKKNDDITEYHLNINANNNIIFSDFFIFSEQKSFVIIDEKGFYYIYFFDKEKDKTINSYSSCKWI